MRVSRPAPAVFSLLVSLLGLGTLARPAAAQSWQRLDAFGPTNMCLPLLLTDGTVIIHDPSARNWHKLTPDEFGSYVHGQWSAIANLPVGYEPLYFASAVLPDGRVIVMGGEYNNGSAVWTKKGAVYDPLSNTWTFQPAPGGWDNIGDAQCTVLADGRFMLANALDKRCAVLDAATLTWTRIGSGKHDSNNEEGWTLLGDGTVLTVDCSAFPASERFLPTLEVWTTAGDTPVPLVDAGSDEIGPAVLLPNGSVFATSATGHTAIYTPPAILTDPGTWVVGPDFPLLSGVPLTIADGPCCLLPSGNVLCHASRGVFQTPSRFFEFDGTNLNAVPLPPRAAHITSFQGNMLMLPTGQVLFTDQSTVVEVYTPAGVPDEAWRPTIASCPRMLRPGEVYEIGGTQFNGLSQASMYGDDSTNATNYPLVRLTSLSSGHVFYARTFGHSTMAVATGATPTSTHFTLTEHYEIGDCLLEVVVNGIPSLPLTVTISKPVRRHGTPTRIVDVSH
jgi:hypothetical protein